MRFIWLLENNRIELYTFPCPYTVIKNVRKVQILSQRACVPAFRTPLALGKVRERRHQTKIVCSSISPDKKLLDHGSQLLQSSPWCGHGAVYCNRGSLGYRLVATTGIFPSTSCTTCLWHISHRGLRGNDSPLHPKRAVNEVG